MYRANIVLATNNTFIPIKHIESINSYREESDVLMDILRKDFVFFVTTLSGKDYEISLLQQLETFDGVFDTNDVQQLFNEFLQRWIDLTTRD